MGHQAVQQACRQAARLFAVREAIDLAVRDRPHQRRLARAVRPAEAVPLAALEAQLRAGEEDAAAVREREVAVAEVVAFLAVRVVAREHADVVLAAFHDRPARRCRHVSCAAWSWRTRCRRCSPVNVCADERALERTGTPPLCDRLFVQPDAQISNGKNSTDGRNPHWHASAVWSPT
jgi:hypothetical protein